MPRITFNEFFRDQDLVSPSMRPWLFATDNLERLGYSRRWGEASMRPWLFATDNSGGTLDDEYILVLQ